MSKKVAIVIGINYIGTSNQLNGCINDADDLKQYLQTHQNYDEFIYMTDNSKMKPTSGNILVQINNVVNRAIAGEVNDIWISYSGHGTYTRDRNGDEDDGKDEMLVPLDYNVSGCIPDDTLHLILNKLPENVKLTCLFDCCHSGTILDLKYRYVPGSTTNVVENQKSSINAHCIMLSGCADTQTSADAYISGQYAGAMTNAFLRSMLYYNHKLTCDQLISKMRSLLHKRYSQIPQLSSSYKVDKNTQF